MLTRIRFKDGGGPVDLRRPGRRPPRRYPPGCGRGSTRRRTRQVLSRRNFSWGGRDGAIRKAGGGRSWNYGLTDRPADRVQRSLRDRPDRLQPRATAEGQGAERETGLAGGREGPADRGSRPERAGPDPARHRSGGGIGSRNGDRGGVRGSGRQAGRLEAAEPARAAGGGARLQL